MINKSSVSTKVDEASLFNYISNMKQQTLPVQNQSIQLPEIKLPIEIPSPTPISSASPSQNIINENLLSKLNNIPMY